MVYWCAVNGVDEYSIYSCVGFQDFLEVRDSTCKYNSFDVATVYQLIPFTDYKSVIASALYGTLAQALTSGLSSTIPKPLDANLLYSVG
jgi:hypothetical protein